MEPVHLSAERLRHSPGKLDPANVEKYLRLRALLPSGRAADRAEFTKGFTDFYNLNIGGLTPEFKNRYFELLFAHRPGKGADPYTGILRELYEFKTRKGLRAVHCSFVSKLVAIHDESAPIYDKHVRQFFAVSVPSSGSLEVKTSKFLRIMEDIRKSYEAWATEAIFRSLLNSSIRRIPALEGCHPTRILDFLIWAEGNCSSVKTS